MADPDNRVAIADRRRVPRGGRRHMDRPGRYPPVLVAESYEGVRKSCCRYLDRFHFQVAEAADGEQALAQIAAHPPQVILAELNLPAMPALRLTQWLTQSWRTRHIPVVVMADEVGTARYWEARAAAAGMLVKPFLLSAMIDEVRLAIRASETRP